MSKTIFISHISDEARLANLLKEHIKIDFLSLVNIYVSSDTDTIIAGTNWFDSIYKAPHNACAVIILCSKASVKRPWVNFEAGAAWIKNIPVVPVCHSGLRPRELSMPLHFLQGAEANQVDGLVRIYTLIANQLGTAQPHVDFRKMCEEVRVFEADYVKLLQETTKAENFKEKAALTRIKDTLRDETKGPWRNIERLASIGGITEGEALDILRNEPDVIFAQGKTGHQIVKLRSR